MSLITQDKYKHIAVLDIGTSKVVAMAAEIDVLGNVKIIGKGHFACNALGDGGVISDIRSLQESIFEAVSAAEKMAGFEIDKILVNFSGNNLQSNFVNVSVDVSSGEISENDIKLIQERAFHDFSTMDQEVIQCVAASYSIDGMKGIRNPRFMYGRKLTAHLNVVTVAKTARENLSNCLARCHLDIESILPSAYVAGLSCLNYEEINDSAIVFDCGAGNIDVGFFLEGKLVYTAFFPLGGKILTKDIQQVFSLSNAVAEKLKVVYGSVLHDFVGKKDLINLKELMQSNQIDDEFSTISSYKLAKILHDRCREIFIYLRDHFRNSPEINQLFQKMSGKIILTGGGANLLGLADLVQDIFKIKTNIAEPVIFEGMEADNNATYAPTLGMIRFASQNLKKNEDTKFNRFTKNSIFLKNMKRLVGYESISSIIRRYF
jgi:cell division protein FtsA